MSDCKRDLYNAGLTEIPCECLRCSNERINNTNRPQYKGLHEIVQGLPPPVHDGPRPNAMGLCQVIVLAAVEVATMNQTGLTKEMIVEDTYKLMRYILDGGVL